MNLSLDTSSQVQFKRLSLIQMFNLSTGIIGLQFAWSMQIALSSRVLEPLGANPFIFGLIWCAGPITGLVIQPLVGAISDKTWTLIGRRRPFILAGSILGALAILLFPFSPTLLIAALLTWIIDACLNTAQGPYRALVPDNVPAEQQVVANSFINFAFGAGSVVALGISPLLKLFNASLSIQQQYIIAALALLLTITYASLTIREIRTRSQKTVSNRNIPSISFFQSLQRFINGNREIHKLCFVQFITWIGLMCMYIYLTPFIVHQVYSLPDFSTPSYKRLESLWKMVEPATRNLQGRSEQIMQIRHIRTVNLAEGEEKLDLILKELAINQSQWLNQQLPAINQNNPMQERVRLKIALLTYHFVSDETAKQPLSKLTYKPLADQFAHLELMKVKENEATNTAQIALVAYNLVALLLTIPMGYLCEKYGKKHLYSLSLFSFAAATAFSPWIHKPEQVIAMMAVAGIGGATILSLPFAMLCEYLPEGEEGTFLGIFNVFICSPQLISALVIGKIIEMSPMQTIFGVTHQWWIALTVSSLCVFFSILVLQAFKEKYRD